MQIVLQQAITQLHELMQRAAQGEHIVIVAEGLPDIELTPVKNKKRQAGRLKHAITIYDPDWDKPSTDIEDEFYQ